MKSKGFIYMTTVIIFLIILIVLFYAYEIYKPAQKDDSVESRIRTMDDFISDLKIDSERAAYIAGLRTLMSLEEYILETSAYLPDLESAFREVFYNGSIGNYSPLIMSDSNFALYLAKINEKSNAVDISLNMTVLEINFTQYNPWAVTVEVLANVSIQDNRGLANWSFEEVFKSDISILGHMDPVYAVNTLGKMQGFVVQTNISDSDFVIGNDTSNLIYHIENLLYKESDKAPNFLMRFEGNLSPDPNGIESLVDIGLIEDQDDEIFVPDYTKSIVDYIYFGNQTTNNSCNVLNMPGWFKIDEEHISDYEIDDLTYASCP